MTAGAPAVDPVATRSRTQDHVAAQADLHRQPPGPVVGCPAAGGRGIGAESVKTTALRTSESARRRRSATAARRALRHLLLALVAAATAVTMSTGVASARTLGGVDEGLIVRWCDRTMGLNILGAAGPMDLFNAYSWKCATTPWIWNGPGVDMNAVCTLQYGSPAWAFTDNPHWAHSWHRRR